MAKKRLNYEEFAVVVTPITVFDWKGKVAQRMGDETFRGTYETEAEAEWFFLEKKNDRPPIDQSLLEVGGVYERIELQYTKYEDGEESLYNVLRVQYFKM